MDKVLETALDLEAQGVSVHYLRPRSKAPVEESWSSLPNYSAERLQKLYRPNYNLGIRLGEPSKTPNGYLHVLDMDVRQPGAAKEARAKLEEMFGKSSVDGFLEVQSGSGGASRHFYLLCDEPFRSRKLATSGEKFVGEDGKKHWTWEIELFGTGKQVAVPPSIHPETGKPYVWKNGSEIGEAKRIRSAKLAELTQRKSDDSPASDNDDLDYLIGRLGWNDKKIRKVLKTLDYDEWGDDYDGWLKVGMALHHETGGSAEGLDLWHDFSEESAKYDPDELDKRWRGFGRAGGDPIRFISMVYEAGLEHMVKVADGFDLASERQFEAADDEDDNEGINPLPEESLPDEGDLKPLPWVLKPYYMLTQLGVTVAPGGVGKSTLTISEALGLASGQQTVGEQPDRPYTVWHWNLEDPEDILARRFAAARRYFGITRDDYRGRLFVNGAEDRLVIATEGKDGVKIAKPIVKAMIKAIRAKGIEVVQVDPFVSSHLVSENSNMAIQAVADTWRYIARETGCAIHLVHHTRKMASGQSGDRTADDARGAGALNAAARMVRVLNPMSKEEAEHLCIDTRWKFIRMDNGKSNFTPPVERAEWFQLESVTLLTDEAEPLEDVGVAVPWEPVAPMTDSFEDREVVAAEMGDEKFRVDMRSPDWIGLAIGRALGLHVEDEKDKREIQNRIKTWLKSGFLKKQMLKDSHRKNREYIVIGEFARQAKTTAEDLLS
jgi:hypothetical protein